MRHVFTIAFGVVLLASVVAWISGILAGVVVPLFGGIRAERLGQIGVAVGMTGEVCAYGFGWLRRRVSQNEIGQVRGFPGPKRYGKKKGVV
jgi:hypothetical protein